jgi:PAS domain S-box-containing protein
LCTTLQTVADLIAQTAERKRAEQSLRTSEERYRLLFERNLAGVFRSTPDGRLLDCNDSFAHILGYASREEVLAHPVWDFYFEAADREALLGKLRARQTLAGYECRLRRKDGSLAWLLESVTLLEGAGGEAVLEGTLFDITERRRLEEQLRQVQKMEAIGQLAGGVAHDFNNLLTAILGNVSLVLAGLPPDDPAAEALQATEKAGLRAAELTRQLLGFSRRTMLRLESVNLAHAVQETVKILRRTIDPRITVEVQAVPKLGLVRADPAQMTQILMNLCLNARDAMPEGGRLLVETDQMTLTEEDVRLRLDARPGEFVRLRVSDTGSGMAPEVRARIFDPFFTTKGPGKGTGLGLAMVFGIVKQHQGWVECYSEVGKGTRFDIYLPREAEVAPAAAAIAPAPGPSGGSETILLADDEAMIRSLGGNILRQYGYRVLLADDGLEAVETYERERGHIDLVILDLTMPRLNGRDALRRILDIDPGARVILASGYSTEHLNEWEEAHILGFLRKPFRVMEFAEAVRVALDRSAEREPSPNGAPAAT